VTLHHPQGMIQFSQHSWALEC